MPRFIFHTLAGAGLLLAMAGAPAQACTMSSWSGTSGSGALSTGTPDRDHRRYQGHCGLKVAADRGGRYVEDASPESETVYFARFYFFAGDLELGGNGWVELFSAYGSGSRPSPELSVRLRQGEEGRELVLRARESSGMTESDPVPVRDGWRGVALTWKQASGRGNGVAELSLDGTPRTALSGLDNGNSVIEMARMGAVEASGSQGKLHFDAFQSRRKTPAEVLVAGDATGDAALDPADLVALVDEINGASLAEGQPDCNGDGTVDRGDLDCLAEAIIRR